MKQSGGYEGLRHPAKTAVKRNLLSKGTKNCLLSTPNGLFYG